MRVSTAFNKVWGIVGATVTAVTFTPEAIVVGLRRRRSKLARPCGWKTREVPETERTQEAPKRLPRQ